MAPAVTSHVMHGNNNKTNNQGDEPMKVNNPHNEKTTKFMDMEKQVSQPLRSENGPSGGYFFWILLGGEAGLMGELAAAELLLSSWIATNKFLKPSSWEA